MTTTVSMPTAVVQTLPLNMIELHPAHPRHDVDADHLVMLSASMERDGLLQYPVCRPSPRHAGRYELVAGFRRYWAARRADWSKLPVIVRELDDVAALRVMGTENLIREDWNPIELAEYLQRLLADCNLTHLEAARMLGRESSEWVSNLLRLLKLPASVQDRVADGRLVQSAARLLLQYGRQPGFYERAERDMDAAPRRWQTRDSIERRLKELAAGENAAPAVVAAAPEIVRAHKRVSRDTPAKPADDAAPPAVGPAERIHEYLDRLARHLVAVMTTANDPERAVRAALEDVEARLLAKVEQVRELRAELQSLRA